MLSEKILPVKYPFITSYPYYANPLAILAATGKEYIPWMVSNFIQLSCHPEGESIKVDYFQPWLTWVPYSCPFLDIQLVNKNIFQSRGTIIESIIDSINLGYYIHLKVNHKYLSFSNISWYGQFDVAHELLIYGYNTPNQTLYVADNFGGKYEFKLCSFGEFIEAYANLPTSNTNYYEKVLLLKPQIINSFDVDILRISDSLNDFLESRDTRIRDDQSLHWANNLTLGISIYEKILEYLTVLHEDETSIDTRLFHVIWEHKKCMVLRINFLQEKGIVLDSKVSELYEGIERKTLIYRNMMIKASISKDKSKINEIAKGIQSFKNTEINLICELLEQLYTNSKRVDTSILGNSINISRKWFLN
jgi:hypothetical protein